MAPTLGSISSRKFFQTLSSFILIFLWQVDLKALECKCQYSRSSLKNWNIHGIIFSYKINISVNLFFFQLNHILQPDTVLHVFCMFIIYHCNAMKSMNSSDVQFFSCKIHYFYSSIKIRKWPWLNRNAFCPKHKILNSTPTLAEGWSINNSAMGSPRRTVN